MKTTFAELFKENMLDTRLENARKSNANARVAFFLALGYCQHGMCVQGTTAA